MAKLPISGMEKATFLSIVLNNHLAIQEHLAALFWSRPGAKMSTYRLVLRHVPKPSHNLGMLLSTPIETEFKSWISGTTEFKGLEEV